MEKINSFPPDYYNKLRQVSVILLIITYLGEGHVPGLPLGNEKDICISKCYPDKFLRYLSQDTG